MFIPWKHLVLDTTVYDMIHLIKLEPTNTETKKKECWRVNDEYQTVFKHLATMEECTRKLEANKPNRIHSW